METYRGNGCKYSLIRDIHIAPFNFDNFRTFIADNFNFQKLIKLGQNSYLYSFGIRTISWRLFLGILQPDATFPLWVKQIGEYREYYNQLAAQYTTIKPSDSPKMINPLELIKVTYLLGKQHYLIYQYTKRQ